MFLYLLISIFSLDNRELKKEAEDAKAIAEQAEQERKKRRLPGKPYQINQLHCKSNSEIMF